MAHTDTHHSFSLEIAIKYGVEKAVIIHHIQHWIKINRRKNSEKHFKEKRWWTYQSYKNIHDFLPYLSEREIKYLITQLTEDDFVLIQDNFNKSPIDKTSWFAFRDESEFLGEPDSNNSYERQNCPSMDKIVRPWDKIVPPIPDPNSDTKTTNKEEGGLPSPKAPSSKKKIAAIKKERAIHVLISDEEHASLIIKAGTEEKALRGYEKLSEWKISHPDYAPQSDYLAILKWVLKAIKTEVVKPKDEDLVELVKKEFGNKVESDIIYGYNYIEFKYIPEAHYQFGENGFAEKVLNALRKMNLSVKSIEEKFVHKRAA